MLPVRVQLLLTAVAVAVTAADLSWLDANLVPNPGFESLAADTGLPEGWTVQASAGGGTAAASDGQVSLEGARAFRLEVTAAGAWIRASSARITVEGGAVYLFSVAFRQEGFNPTGGADTYAGVSSHPAVHWFDAAGQQVGGSTVVSRFPYGPCAWDLRDALERAPAQARSARILVTLSLDAKAQSGQAIASKLWLDAAQLRHYRPPPTPDWARGETARNVDGGIAENRLLSFFVGSDEQFHSRNGKWSRTTSDSAAERGVCLLAPAGVGQGMMAHSPYFPALPPGLYRLRVRARFGAPAAAASGYVDLITESAGQRQFLPMPEPQGGAAGTYRVIESDFILRDQGWWCLRLFTYGRDEWAVDSCKVIPLHEFLDRQLLELYPGSAGEIPAELKPAPFVPALGGPPKPMRALVVAGLGYDRFRLADVIHVLHRDAQATPVWVRMDRGRMQFDGFPEDPCELFQYSIVYFCDVSARCLGLKIKNAVCEYVKRGGALVVLGGHQAFERGGWRGSMLEEVLPVEPGATGAAGVRALAPGEPLLLDGHLPGREALVGGVPPRVYYVHRVGLKPGAQVWARVGGEPFLVAGTSGEGRTVCVLSLPCGEPRADQTPFWAWDGWVGLLREVSWWAVRNPSITELSRDETP